MTENDTENPPPTHWEVTGNHYIAFPCISPADGGIYRLNVLHRGLNGLLEWVGDTDPIPTAGPLLSPRFHVDGREERMMSIVWDRVDRWIPRFRAVLPAELRVEGTLCAPGAPDFSPRGAVYRLEVQNDGKEEREVDVALQGVWRNMLRTLATPRRCRCQRTLLAAGNPQCLLLEADLGSAGAALAIAAGRDAVHAATARNGEPPRTMRPGESLHVEDSASIRVSRRLRIAPGARVRADFFLAVAPERDGAHATVDWLRRIGGEESIRRARLELAAIIRRSSDAAIGGLLNRCLVFNHYFAVGRAIDDDRLYPIVSRSPLCPGAATFDEQRALLWSLPALTISDPWLARDALITAFEFYSQRAGEGVRYLDGGLLSPGFALDRLCAYGIALDRYVRESDDPSILHEPIVQDVLRELDEALGTRLHPKVYLFGTELRPSGAPSDHAYVTYSNVAVWALARAFERVWAPMEDADRPRLAGAREEIASAVWRHCTAETEGYRVLAWSTDLEGDAVVYDDPYGSLQWLPHFGFCDADDPVWRNTVDLLRSDANPFWHGEAAFPGLGGRERPEDASLVGLCADLLGSRKEAALTVLRRLPLDAGLVAEWFDPATGRSTANPYSPAAAGLLAWALWTTMSGARSDARPSRETPGGKRS